MNIIKKLTQSSNALVEEIHEEFDSAEDRLLNEAKNLLQELGNKSLAKEEEEIIQKGERLVRIGFIATEHVVKALEIKKNRDKNQQILVKNREQAELIQYYKQTYPFQKFLTEQELDRICAKYELIYAPVSNYTKEVPEKNLREIENCQILNDKDSNKDTIKVIISESYRKNKDIDSLNEICVALDKSEAIFTHEECISLLRASYPCPLEDWSLFGSRSDMFFFIIYKKLGLADFPHKFKMEKVVKQGLFIAAPPSHFNLKDLKQDKKNKFGFFNIQITEINDPIVFRYCRGGIQVISKWGLEAKDETLINPIEN